MKKTTREHLLRPFAKCSIFLLFLFGWNCAAQTTLSGEILDTDDYPIAEATVVADGQTTTTDANGRYSLTLSGAAEIAIQVSKEGFLDYAGTKQIRPNQDNLLYIQLATNPAFVELKEVIFQKKDEAEAVSSIELDPALASLTPSLSGGITDLLKTLPYVSVTNELSSQYNVRGGNFDENLIYVNGIEIYRPQLIRSGQQEGLGFVNPNMVEKLNFSAGGWEAKYGDKMSSVLDITYKNPKKFEAQAEASLIGGSLTVGAVSKSGKVSGIVGARYLNRNLVLNTLDGQTDFNPTYVDVQANVNYNFNRKWNLNFLGNIARNRFDLIPENRETDFGSLNQPLRLTVFYDGQEEDQFNSETAALTLNYKPTKRLTLSLGGFGYHSLEQEYFTIAGAYLISEVDPITGASTQTFDVGGQIDNARNDLDLLVAGAQHRGKFKFNPNSFLEWGVKFQTEDIRDRQNEWQLVDSAGFSRPNNFTLGSVNPGDLQLNYSIFGRNNLNSQRYSGFLQYSQKWESQNSKIFVNAGVRATHWTLNGETNFSPRAQIALKPNWRRDMLFRFSTGLYYQPPFYRELRDPNGVINENVKAQQSLHFILGHDYEFKMFGRKAPFKLSTEIYYKDLQNLNPYFVNNVRIRYSAANNSKGNAYGIDMRLNGEFVEGVESWFSLSYARANQNIDGRGNIPLPTDPRFKASLFFQDYMEFLPSFKVNVNLIYASGLPNGAPEFTDPYEFTDFLQDYRRVDIGFVKELINQKELKPNRRNKFWSGFEYLAIGLDVFNVFDIQNEISNTWIQDVNSNRIFAVPNRLTGRFLNVKLTAKF